MKRLLLAALALPACASAQSATPPPKAAAGVDVPAERVPTDIRRVSLIVRSIDNSLKLYRDVVGLKVNYDSEVTMSGVALPAGRPGAKARLVLLNGNDPWIGWIGMLEWLDPKLPEAASDYPKRLTVGGHVIVMNTDDVDGKCAAAAKVPGVTMTAPPRLQEYPGRNGGPVIRVKGCNFFDPDGTLIEMNQILE